MPDILKIYRILSEEYLKYQSPVVDLVKAQTSDPFKILVTTILSARTKDETTTQVIKKLFQKVNTPEDLEKLSLSEIEELIYPAGFYHNKAKSLQKLPSVLATRFEGKVPSSIDELLELPGVGRKTANLVRTIAFDKDGICVDVHVHRISNRLGYVNTTTPLETEMALRDKLPKELWSMYNSYLVAFGQNLCTPRNPHCNLCPIFSECERVNVFTKFKKDELK
ncbi:MAG: endonuclease III [Candidatus Cloacimonetes bacterium]|nr:endonuclease III [Candidatus Cloacimonadota bacterium]